MKKLAALLFILMLFFQVSPAALAETDGTDSSTDDSTMENDMDDDSDEDKCANFVGIRKLLCIRTQHRNDRAASNAADDRVSDCTDLTGTEKSRCLREHLRFTFTNQRTRLRGNLQTLLERIRARRTDRVGERQDKEETFRERQGNRNAQMLEDQEDRLQKRMERREKVIERFNARQTEVGQRLEQRQATLRERFESMQTSPQSSTTFRRSRRVIKRNTESLNLRLKTLRQNSN